MRSFAKIYRLTFLSALNLTSIFVSPIIRIMTCGLIPPRKLGQKLYWIHKEDDRVYAGFPGVHGLPPLIITSCENGIPRRRWQAMPVSAGLPNRSANIGFPKVR